MPRTNRHRRTIDAEEVVARRVAVERERRHWTYDGLAERMTEQGCAIQGSAIYKIEKANPPRRITVDELAAFALVFEMRVEDLLRDDGVTGPEAALIDEVQEVAVIGPVRVVYDLLGALADYEAEATDAVRERVEPLLDRWADDPEQYVADVMTLHFGPGVDAAALRTPRLDEAHQALGRWVLLMRDAAREAAQDERG